MTKNVSLLVPLLVLISGVSLTSPAEAQARQFRVRNDGGSRIQFVSDAPLETITGVSSAVSGELSVDTSSLSTITGRVQVGVATLRSGVDLRDEHLSGEQWLDAAHHANATFEITRVEGARALRPNRAATVRVHGRFTIHGVTKVIVAQARVRLMPLTEELAQTPGIDGDVLRIQASFTVLLTDYDVSVPLPVRLKVSNEIQVNVDLRAIATPESSGTAH